MGTLILMRARPRTCTPPLPRYPAAHPRGMGTLVLRARFRSCSPPPEMPGSAPAAPPSTPLTAIYKSPSDYNREAAKLRTILEASDRAVAQADGDEELLGEVKRRLQRTQPPEFLKGSWFKAAEGKTSAMQSNGQSMRYGDLMKDQIFNDYQELVRRVNVGLL